MDGVRTGTCLQPLSLRSRLREKRTPLIFRTAELNTIGKEIVDLVLDCTRNLWTSALASKVSWFTARVVKVPGSVVEPVQHCHVRAFLALPHGSHCAAPVLAVSVVLGHPAPDTHFLVPLARGWSSRSFRGTLYVDLTVFQTKFVFYQRMHFTHCTYFGARLHDDQVRRRVGEDHEEANGRLLRKKSRLSDTV